VHVPDEELVARVVAQGDRQAFGELVSRHQSRIRGWLRSLTRDPALADDLAQDTFLRAWDKLPGFTGRGRFAAWLMQVAFSVFAQSRREAQRRARLNEAASREIHTLGRDVAAPPAGEQTELDRLLAVLSPEERAVMVLSFAHGMSNAEVSEVTGLALGTVKSHIKRGRARIRARFLPQGVASD